MTTETGALVMKSILIAIDLQKVFDIGADYTSNYGKLGIHGGIGKNKELETIINA